MRWISFKATSYWGSFCCKASGCCYVKALAKYMHLSNQNCKIFSSNYDGDRRSAFLDYGSLRYIFEMIKI